MKPKSLLKFAFSTMAQVQDARQFVRVALPKLLRTHPTCGILGASFGGLSVFDSCGLIVDQTGDGGDSCNFTCVYLWLLQELGLATPAPTALQKTTALLESITRQELTALQEKSCWQKKVELFWNNGQPLRHPVQNPWNNPRNFTRDQAIPLLKILPPKQCRTFFWSCFRRGFFLPNFERDEPGTQKHPYPHHFTNDHGHPEKRIFDFADWAGLDFIGFMILRGQIRWLYPFLPLAWLYAAAGIVLYCILARDPAHNDFKQTFLIAEEFGLEKFFYKIHPRSLEEDVESYFNQRRNLPELSELWKLYLRRFRTPLRNELYR